MNSVMFPSLTFVVNHRLRCSFGKFDCSLPKLRCRDLRSFERVCRCPKIVRASSSASISVPDRNPDLYTDPLEDSKSKKRRTTIAGVVQDELLDPENLAEPESRFCEFQGGKIHHQLYETDPESGVATESNVTHSVDHLPKFAYPLILLHGFGASVYSWKASMKLISQLTNSKVLAFDRPAFGLSARVDSRSHMSSTPNPLNPYSLAYSVLLTLHFIDSLAAEKAVLIGHSAGCLVAVNTYFEAPHRVAALILVAPAILAPVAFPNIFPRKSSTHENQFQGKTTEPNNLKDYLAKLLSFVVNVTTWIAQAISRIMTLLSDFANFIYKKSLSAFLSSFFGIVLIRMVIDKLGIAAVRSAWYDASKIGDEVMDGYLKPLRVKGWDKGLAEFVSAMVGIPESASSPPCTKKLEEIACPVLIITGEDDKLVPSWNSKRLSQAIPGCCFQVIKRCGHLPHEEKVQEFVSAVVKFLHSH